MQCKPFETQLMCFRRKAVSVCVCLRDGGTGEEYRVEGGIPSEPPLTNYFGDSEILRGLKKKIVSNLPCHLMFASI